MWVKFNLQGMKLKFKVEKYIPNQTIDGEWTEVLFNFEFQNVIKYSTNKNEILLSSDVDDIRDYMEMLLNDKFDEGLTCNYFCTSFDREEIETFYLYFLLETNKISKDNAKIINLITKGIIYRDIN